MVELSGIDLKALNAVSFEKVWAEAYGDFRRHGAHSFRLTPEERQQMENINGSYRIESEEERLIRDLFDWEQPVEEWKEYTATQIAELIGHNVSVRRVTKVIKGIFSGDVKSRVIHGYPVYLMPKRKYGEF